MNMSEKYICFLVGKERFAIPLLKVREVIGMPQITPFPQSPTHVVGIFNLRGQIITIFDLRSRLNSKAKGDQPTVIICDIENGQIGLIVDFIANVLSVETDQLSNVPEGTTTQGREFVTNIYSAQDELTLMLDVDQILGRDVKVASIKANLMAS